ncbi:hypothetical protein S2091_4711 [Solimicrobium silvestre]|uniref:Tetratricopeptide repeat n=2 Tax=Solimicrobium silvestre TaxID=2099400 RepID=A0A2S9GS86_9BURK|nr:hypothetical protein S2091_4711 [Solimicrobium silvestre]
MIITVFLKVRGGNLSKVIATAVVSIVCISTASLAQSANNDRDAIAARYLSEAGSLASKAEPSEIAKHQYLLTKIAEYQVKAGDEGGARETLKIARDFMLKTKSDHVGDGPYVSLATANVVAGDAAAAVDIIFSDPMDSNHAHGLFQISREQVLLGNLDQAQQTITAIGELANRREGWQRNADLKWHDEALRLVAGSYAAAEKFTDASVAINSIQDVGIKAEVLGSTALVATRAGKLNLAREFFDQAIAFAIQIGTPTDPLHIMSREFVLNEIAVNAATAGDRKNAFRLVDLQGKNCRHRDDTSHEKGVDAEELKRTSSLPACGDRDLALAFLVQGFSGNDDLSNAEKLASTLPIGYPHDMAQSALSGAQARTNAIEAAIVTAQGISMSVLRDKALLRITEIAAKKEKHILAKKSISHIDNVGERARAMLIDAIQLVSAGKLDEAWILADEVQEMATFQMNYNQRIDAISTAAAIFSLRSLADAETLLGKLNECERNTGFLRSAKILANHGRHDEAISALRLAFNSVPETCSNRGMKLQFVARERVRNGDQTQAAEDIAKLADRLVRAEAFLGLASGLWSEPEMPLMTPGW